MSHDAMIFISIWCGAHLVFSSIFGSISFFMKRHIKMKREKCTEKTIGQVKEIVAEHSHSSNGCSGRMYYPVIAYEVMGNIMKQQASVGTNPSRYVVGQSVPVWYNPKTPGEIMIEGDRTLNLLANIFAIVTGIILAMGLLGIVIACWLGV